MEREFELKLFTLFNSSIVVFNNLAIEYNVSPFFTMYSLPVGGVVPGDVYGTFA